MPCESAFDGFGLVFLAGSGPLPNGGIPAFITQTDFVDVSCRFRLRARAERASDVGFEAFRGTTFYNRRFIVAEGDPSAGVRYPRTGRCFPVLVSVWGG